MENTQNSKNKKLTETRFVLLDVETTDPDKNIVIEIGALQWQSGKVFGPPDLKENLVDPGCLIDPATRAVHHISDEDVKGKPKLESIIPDWMDWINGAPVVAYNSDFDKQTLSETQINECLWLDAYRMAMHCWSIGQVNEDGFALRSFKQQELRYWLKLPQTFGDAHRASADVQVTAYILDKVVDMYLNDFMGKDDLDSFINWVNAPIAHMTIPVGGSNYSGKTPEELDDYSIKKAFDQKWHLYETFAKFNIHEALRPQYIARFGQDPMKPSKASPNISGRGK